MMPICSCPLVGARQTNCHDGTRDSGLLPATRGVAHTTRFEVRWPPAETIETKLGGRISGLRNTDYDVSGQRVRINLMVAPDAANADKLMAGLSHIKSKDALLRQDLIIYEFVGTNDVLPLIHEGRTHLAGAKWRMIRALGA
jgi:hypothetical protein